jgi:hypothetical protein
MKNGQYFNGVNFDTMFRREGHPAKFSLPESTPVCSFVASFFKFFRFMTYIPQNPLGAYHLQSAPAEFPHRST